MNNQRGFTLLEALIGMSIASFLMFFALTVQKDVLTLNAAAQAGFAAQDDARRSFKRMTAELRTANYADNGAYTIAAAAADSVTFYSDADANGVTERIRYYVSGTTLKRGIIIPTGAPAVYTGAETSIDLVKDLASTAIFSYYDTSYDGTTGPLSLPAQLSDIRLIGITLTIDKNGARVPGPQSFVTQVSLRNLKDNL